MNVSEFMIVTNETSELLTQINGYLCLRPVIVCNDGFQMSVQAGGWHYSSPRNISIEYSKVEIRFPSEEESLIAQYAVSADLTNTMYPYVPIDVVEKVVKKHRGINVKETFNK